MKRPFPSVMLITVLATAASHISGAAPDAASGPATRPASAAEQELSATILQDARPGYLPKETRQLQMHARRGAALSQLALRIDRGNLLAHATLAEAREAVFDMSAAAEAAKAYLRLVDYTDHRWFTKYLSYGQAASKKAEERLAFLEEVLANERLPASARALALTTQAALSYGIGDFAKSNDLRKAALALDGNLVEAAFGVGGLSSSTYSPLSRTMTDLQEAEVLLTILRADPSAVSAAWDLARLCRRIGDYPSSMVFYDHARRLAAALGSPLPAEFDLDYLNMLLDAGLLERAVQEFAEKAAASSATALASDPASAINLLALLVEAYRGLGQAEAANALVERMEQAYTAEESKAQNDTALAAGLAWFHHRFSRRSEEAVRWSAIALRGNPADATIQRIWAVIMMGSSQAAVARNQLDQLAATDPYAAMALAEYEFSQGNSEEGQRRLDQAARSIRAHGRWPNGRSEWQIRPAWRQVVEVATRYGAKVSEAPEAAEVSQRVRMHDARYLEMGQHPERYLSIRLKPLAGEVRPGEPLLIEAVLTNTGSLTVPVSGTQFTRPTLLANISSRQPGHPADIEARTLIDWPAPKYLQAGASLSHVFLADVGAVRQALQANPLADFELSISAIYDPVERDKQFVPRFAALKVEPIQLRRVALLTEDDPAVYWSMLVELVRQLRSGDELTSMRAATVTVSLLKMAQDVKAGQGRVGPNIRGNLYEPELLSMLRFCLQQASPNVKVRTIGAMQTLDLSGIVGQLLRPCLQSPEAVVRARAADLVGMSTNYTDKVMLRELAINDGDPVVREVARVHVPMPTTVPSMMP